MKVKKNRESSTIFALSTDTKGVEKYSKDADGNIIDSNFNNKTFIKKAYKSYLKGKDMFMYKGQSYVVPKINKNFKIDEK